MVVKYEYCDVTTKMPEYVTAHCISEDCAMGAGVVLAFRRAFPGLKAACMEHMNDSKAAGKITEHGIPIPYRHWDGGKVVYNMFTKSRYWHHVGKGIAYDEYLGRLQHSLELVRAMMTQHGESKLAIPMIGCGLDKCKWEDVKARINIVFFDTDIEICVCKWK